MKIFTLLITLLCIAQLTHAQQSISGTVTNDFGDALDDVHVKIKGAQTGAISENGNFIVQATPGDTLVFSHTGYRTKEVEIGMQNEVTVELDIESLDEVLVVGVALPRNKRSIICCLRTFCGLSITDKTPVSEQKLSKIERSMVLYPNPSPNGVFTVKSLVSPFTDISLGVFNMTGQRIMSFSVTNVNAGIKVDLSNHPSGMYLIKLVAGENEIETIKAIRM